MTEPSGWRKSVRSGDPTIGTCVELSTRGLSAVRDSKDPDGGCIDLSGGRLPLLLAEIKSGRYDLAGSWGE